MDLVLGVVTDYKYEQIEPWVVSLERSGYQGKKALIAYNMDVETVRKLSSKNIDIFAFNTDEQGNLTYKTDENFSIMVERFIHAWHFLSKMEDISNVIMTDVRDVVFQTDPSEWLEQNITFGRRVIAVASENFRYKDEPWGKNNLTMSFGPAMYEMLKDEPIYCAGVIAGEFHYIRDLFLNVFLLCRGSRPHIPGGGGPDQAALNILVNNRFYTTSTMKLHSDDDFVLHAGTSVHAIKSYKGEIGYQYMLDNSKMPIFKEAMIVKGDAVFEPTTGIVKNSRGTPYCIVHQYDRVNEWKDIIDKKYREAQ
jgi:hypothetical protein